MGHLTQKNDNAEMKGVGAAPVGDIFPMDQQSFTEIISRYLFVVCELYFYL